MMETAGRRVLLLIVPALCSLIATCFVFAAPQEKAKDAKETKDVVDEEDRIPTAEKKTEGMGDPDLTLQGATPEKRAAEMSGYFIKRYEKLNAASFNPIAQAIAKTGVPHDYMVCLADYYANGLWISGQRWEMDPDVEIAKIAAIPAESQVVKIAKGEMLQPRIAGLFPAYERLSGMSKRLVLDYLVSINPAMKATGYYIAEEDKVKEPGEHAVMPLGNRKVAVHLYVVEPGKPVIVPPVDTLARQANPDALRLRGTWIGDLAVLNGLTPVELSVARTRVKDLSLLKNMKSVKRLNLSGTEVSDLSPLTGMPLETLDISGTRVTDLSPLKGMPLGRLSVADTIVSDLKPLAGMPIKHLNLEGTRVVDLSPLKGMELTYLNIDFTKVSDVAALAGMPLECLVYPPGAALAGLDAVSDIGSLKTVAYLPAAEWHKKYDATATRTGKKSGAGAKKGAAEETGGLDL